MDTPQVSMVQKKIKSVSTMDQWQAPMLCAATIQCGLANLCGTPMDLFVLAEHCFPWALLSFLGTSHGHSLYDHGAEQT